MRSASSFPIELTTRPSHVSRSNTQFSSGNGSESPDPPNIPYSADSPEVEKEEGSEFVAGGCHTRRGECGNSSAAVAGDGCLACLEQLRAHSQMSARRSEGLQTVIGTAFPPASPEVAAFQDCEEPRHWPQAAAYPPLPVDTQAGNWAVNRGPAGFSGDADGLALYFAGTDRFQASSHPSQLSPDSSAFSYRVLQHSEGLIQYSNAGGVQTDMYVGLLCGMFGAFTLRSITVYRNPSDIQSPPFRDLSPNFYMKPDFTRLFATPSEPEQACNPSVDASTPGHFYYPLETEMSEDSRGVGLQFKATF